MTFQTIEGGDGLPPEPDWTSIYNDELDIAAAHEHWGTVTRTLQAANTIDISNGDAIRRLDACVIIRPCVAGFCRRHRQRFKQGHAQGAGFDRGRRRCDTSWCRSYSCEPGC